MHAAGKKEGKDSIVSLQLQMVISFVPFCVSHGQLIKNTLALKGCYIMVTL